VLLTAIIITLMLIGSTRRANEAAAARQQNLAELVLRQSITQIPYDQESTTVWDDPILKLRESALDMEWLDENMGVWLHSYFGHDEVYIVDPTNRPVYAMQNGERTDPAAFNVVSPAVTPLIEQLRVTLRDDPTAGVTGAMLSPGASDVGVADGHPAIISVKPVVPNTNKIEQAPGSEFLHISIRFLDGSFLSNLERDYLFEGARFAWENNGTSTERSIPILSVGGKNIGFLIWTPFAPGSSVFSSLIPALAGALAVVGLVVGLLMRRVRRGAKELQASEAQAQHLAFHDTLTGLPNRALFVDRLERCLTEVRRNPQRSIALLYCDLDRFKQVNDTLGHPAGDELIREVGRRLSSVVRENDTVARIGGDEFAIIQTDLRSAGDTETICRRILECITAPFELFGNQVFVGVTIGVSVAPTDALDRIELTRKADIALYNAKEAGRGRFVMFADDMDASIRHRRTIERDLRDALLAGDQLKVHYQPLHVAGTGEIAGVEALVRWQHPRDGMMAPVVFIPIAEESGLIEPLGEWVLREACSAAAKWPVPKVTVNVSPVQLRNPTFPLRVVAILKETGLPPERLELEVTETALMESADQCGPILQALRAAGVKIALDDFGTGYSSLSHLRQFQVDRVKIDQSFVRGLSGAAAENSAIVQAIVDLAQATGLKVTAEGVETAEQSSFLSGIGCNELQGFLLSHPMSGEQLDQLLGVDDKYAAA
jgi:diguanylate cyclase (GGDEF)-like protein